MKVLLSGAGGFIGSHLMRALEGCEVVRLVRSDKGGKGTVYWDPAHGKFQKEPFEGFDAVVHLAGANIAEKRWTKKRKEELFISRCRDTWLLSQVLCRLYQPPKVLFCASAVGFYGDRGDEELSEGSAQGTGFLADLAGKWEKATDAIENRGTRVVHGRFGMVLSPEGGALAKLLPLYRWGLGGKLGSGKQWISWIALEDLAAAVVHCLRKEELSGAVNFVSPHPVRQEEFVREIARKLHRPAIAHVPAWALRLVLGEMAQELLLSGQRVKPVKLLESGFSFRYAAFSSFSSRSDVV